MKILVTGATGFLGRAVVAAAVAAGHRVVAMVRPTANTDALGWGEAVEIVRGDLRQRGPWCDRVRAVDAVVHLAAALSGDLAQQFAGTVVATETLLDSLDLAALGRFVHVSSFSVYGYSDVAAGTPIDESSALETRPDLRDAYTTTKMVQERLVADACRAAGTHYVVLRPGAIYGPGKDWDFGRAMKLGGFDLVFAPMARFRLTFVDNCAEAIVRAIDRPVASGSVFNIVDDNPPTHRRYRALCRAAGARMGRTVLVPWLAVAALGRGVALLDRLAFGGRAKLPEILAYRRQQVRWRPFAYPNAAAKAGLDWTPRTTLEEGVIRTVQAENKG